MDRHAVADALNRHCHCINVDPEQLRDSLESRFSETNVWQALRESHPHLFANSPVFISADHLAQMQAVIDAVEQVVSLEAYQRQALERVPAIARHNQGTHGVFFGYDFHLTNSGPRLIEINTNAGGALLLLHAASAQKACCDEVENLVTGRTDLTELEQTFVAMFSDEWRLHEPGRALRRVAIVDENPGGQYLGPEFVLFKEMFKRHGIDAIVTGPETLALQSGALHAKGRPIDLVYNRLTDFYLESGPSNELRTAYLEDHAVVTPSPHTHALYANKHNLITLSDPELLDELGADSASANVLTQGIPRTTLVTSDNADALWADRKQLFFKPAWGFGSRGTYKGAKLTRKTWESIVGSNYVAQELVPPSERLVITDGDHRAMKLDVRCFTYKGEIQILGARLYRGQTTNFRTDGGGLATVFLAP